MAYHLARWRSIIKCICFPPSYGYQLLFLEYIIILPELFQPVFSLSTKFISDETFSYTIVLLLSNHLLNRNDVSLLYWCCNKCRYTRKKAPAVIRQGLNQLNLYNYAYHHMRPFVTVGLPSSLTFRNIILSLMLPIILYCKVLQGCLEVIFNYALLTPASTIPARYCFLS